MSRLIVDEISTTDETVVVEVKDLVTDKVQAAAGTPVAGAILRLGDTSGIPTVTIPDDPTQRLLFAKKVMGVDDYAVVQINRDNESTGGTAGFVGSGLRVNTTAGANTKSFEWGITGIVDNYASKGVENVGIYAQGNKHSTGGTWGGVWEVCDFNDRVSTASDGLTWGGEVDLWTDYADTAGVRKGLSIVVGSKVNIRDGLTPGQHAEASVGLNITSYNGNYNYAGWLVGIQIDQVKDTGLLLSGGATRGIQLTNGNYGVGVDTSAATLSAAAFRMALGQFVSFDTDDAHQLLVDGGSFQLRVNGTSVFGVDTDGSGISAPALKLNNDAVVLNGAITTSATAGGGQAVPASVLGFLTVVVNGRNCKIPYFGE